MSERLQAEAARLWRYINELEKTPVRTEAEIAWKKKEMAKLKAAYEKVTGVLADAKSDAVKSKAKALGTAFGGRPEHETRDTLNQFHEEYSKAKRKLK